MGSITAVTDETFRDEVISSPVLTVTDLWAEWCGPCKRITPMLEEIASEYTGRIKVTKLDVDENPRVPEEYGVQGIPTLLVFRDGQLVESIMGLMPKQRLLERILPHLGY